MILETIHTPADVKALDRSELPVLCGELRQFLVGRMSPKPAAIWPPTWERWS
nr:1-deoxy-D-xylulose-5-phosphate synthase N-terminal domain-containing protein [Dysosmobacter welbionis]